MTHNIIISTNYNCYGSASAAYWGPQLATVFILSDEQMTMGEKVYHTSFRYWSKPSGEIVQQSKIQKLSSFFKSNLSSSMVF